MRSADVGPRRELVRAAGTVAAAGTWPYAALVADNLGESLALGQLLLLWSATVVLLVGVVVAVWRLGSREAAMRTAVPLAVATVAFFAFGPVTALLGSLGLPGDAHVPAWGVVTVVLVGVAVWVGRWRVARVAVAAGAIALLAAAALQAAVRLPAAVAAPEVPVGAATIGDGQRDPASLRLPNVYVFVVDGYGRPDVLEELYGLAPDRAFLDGLHDRGFAIPSAARANYPTTYLSVASLLDASYVLDVHDHPFPARDEFDEVVQGDNATVATLRQLGYSYLHAPPAVWEGSACSGVEDRCVTAPAVFGETEWALLSRTPLVEPLSEEFLIERAAPSSDPSAITAAVLTADDDPRLLVAHVLSPHPPYLYRADCSLRDEVVYDLVNWRLAEVAQYGEAMTCLNRQLTDAVDAILAVDDDPVIVVTGDHGPEFLVEWARDPATWTREATRERTAVFSAIRLPEDCDVEVPDDLTLVNTMRLVVACLTGEPPELLPDRVFVGSFKREDMAIARW